MNLNEKLAVLGAKQREWIDEDIQKKKWAARVTLALKLVAEPLADDAAMLPAKERIVKALAKSMFVRAVLAGHTYGVDPIVRDQILADKDALLTALGVTLKLEGMDTGDVADVKDGL